MCAIRMLIRTVIICAVVMLDYEVSCFPVMDCTEDELPQKTASSTFILDYLYEHWVYV